MFHIRILLVSLYKDLCYVIFIRIIDSNKNFSFLLLSIGFPNFNIGKYCQVKQLLAVDGRLHLNFEIASTGSSQNYTRSYYMNGRDYIISGSCDEQVVRICCTQTGRRLKDVSLEVNESPFLLSI